jgi:hypothetical protein
MGAFVSGLANVLNKPAVQKGLKAAGTVADAYMPPQPQQLSPAQATGQPVATQGPGFSGVNPPSVGEGIASLVNKLRARQTRTNIGAGLSPDIGGGGIGAVSPLGYNGDSVR